MLADFKQLLIDNNLYFESRICDLESSCSSSETVVIDFDKIKDEFWKRFRKGEMRMPKSADALILKPESSELIFIEMKDFKTKELIGKINTMKLELESYKKTLAKSNNEVLKNEKRVLEDFINIKFQLMFANQFEADKKLIDSYALLLDIATTLKINPTFYPILFNSIDKQFIFVLNMTSRDYTNHFISAPTIRNRYKYLIFNNVNFILATTLDKVLHK